MDQIKFYKFAIYGLILLNVLVLGFFLLSSSKQEMNRPRPHHNFETEVAGFLEFTSDQQVVFDQSHDRHEKQMRRINQEEEELLLSYFDNIANPTEEMDSALVITQFQQLQRQKLVLTQQHFLEIKSILNTDQLVDFESLMRRVAERIVSRRKK